MSTFADNARDWWERKNPRERGLLMALAVVAPITIAVFLGSYISDGSVKEKSFCCTVWPYGLASAICWAWPPLGSNQSEDSARGTPSLP